MIEYTGNPDDGTGSPRGYGPRLHVKFEHDFVLSPNFNEVCSKLNKLSTWGGYDRIRLSKNTDRFDRILSWEFPNPWSNITGFNFNFENAIKYLKEIEAVRSSNADFFDNFSES